MLLTLMVHQCGLSGCAALALSTLRLGRLCRGCYAQRTPLRCCAARSCEHPSAHPKEGPSGHYRGLISPPFAHTSIPIALLDLPPFSHHLPFISTLISSPSPPPLSLFSSLLSMGSLSFSCPEQLGQSSLSSCSHDAGCARRLVRPHDEGVGVGEGEASICPLDDSSSHHLTATPRASFHLPRLLMSRMHSRVT